MEKLTNKMIEGEAARALNEGRKQTITRDIGTSGPLTALKN